MTARLERAINQLTPSQLEQLTQVAETLVKQGHPTTVESDQKVGWRFDWVGSLADQPEKSGVEAQRTAMTEWEAMIERGLSK